MCLTTNSFRHEDSVDKSRFKRELRVSLLNTLQSENEYIVVPELITGMPKARSTV